jgi:zinc transporter, ZIP family
LEFEIWNLFGAWNLEFGIWNLNMSGAFIWGSVAASSLILGGLLTFWFKISSRILGLIMAFGSGVLISAVAYELVHEALESTGASVHTAYGLMAGALAFFAGSFLIDKMGGRSRKKIGASHKSELGLPILLGIILDGIPESIVIGVSLLSGGTIGLSFLLAVLLSNLPESIASTSGLVEGGWGRLKILGLWLLVALLCGLAALAGYALFRNATPASIAFIQTFACGAILVMLSDTMMPEAFEHGGRLAGLITVVGFGLAVYISVLQ